MAKKKAVPADVTAPSSSPTDTDAPEAATKTKAKPKAARAPKVPAGPKTGKTLVIVESPAKAKKINEYLGSNYIVKASMGHVRDLPKKGMGVDVTTFVPEYVVIEERGKDKVVSELRKLAKEAPEIFLATDLDREGEAIAWHLAETLKIPTDIANRVVFNAITKSEIQKAFEHPRPLNMDRVNAQQARRVLDRLVGWEVSPVLWRKVSASPINGKKLSAGRVQSVAVRLVVEREREIEAFIPDEYWSINAIFGTQNDPKLVDGYQKFMAQRFKPKAFGAVQQDAKEVGPNQKQIQAWLGEHDLFEAELIEVAGKKLDAITPEDARTFATAAGFKIVKTNIEEDPKGKGPAKKLVTLVGSLADVPGYAVKSIEKKRSSSRPPGPFITSTLQQAASTRLGFGAQRTMRAAQKLYEAGHITYMRTDSTHLSGDALEMARTFIAREFGDKYVPEKPNFFSSSNKDAQEAHEAIRPTNVQTLSKHIDIGADEARLYELIYNRFVACQMTPAQWDQTVVLISAGTKAGELIFKATGRKLVFDGFMRVAGVWSDDQLLPELAEAQKVFPADIAPSQHFTSPPPRFTEASLIKELESKGIGRPSTYASIIQTIQDREYVLQQDRRFWATQLGKVVTDKLIQAFPAILDIGFTADMEKKLDDVEEQHVDWIQMLKDFYGPFHEGVAGSIASLTHAGGAPSGIKCEKCGKEMLYRISGNGFFLACEDRDCGNTMPVDKYGNPSIREVSPFSCPTCGREMMKRSGRFGPYLSCTGYSIKTDDGKPSCSTIIALDKNGVPQPPKVKIVTEIACEKCGNPMVLRNSKRGPFLGCSTYPKCKSLKYYAKLDDAQKAQVDALMPELKKLGAAAMATVEKLKSQAAGAAPVDDGVASMDTIDLGPTEAEDAA
jgi:DNA topoisomerase I